MTKINLSTSIEFSAGTANSDTVQNIDFAPSAVRGADRLMNVPKNDPWSERNPDLTLSEERWFSSSLPTHQSGESQRRHGQIFATGTGRPSVADDANAA